MEMVIGTVGWWHYKWLALVSVVGRRCLLLRWPNGLQWTIACRLHIWHHSADLITLMDLEALAVFGPCLVLYRLDRVSTRADVASRPFLSRGCPGRQRIQYIKEWQREKERSSMNFSNVQLVHQLVFFFFQANPFDLTCCERASDKRINRSADSDGSPTALTSEPWWKSNHQTPVKQSGRLSVLPSLLHKKIIKIRMKNVTLL